MRFTFRKKSTKTFYGIFFGAIFFTIWIFLLSRKKPLAEGEESQSYGATNEIVNPFAYPVLINPNVPACSDPNSQMDTVIFVISHPKSAHRRSIFRSTMGNEPLKNFFKFDVVYVLGKADDNETQQEYVDQEAAEFGDILQADFHEGYWNLTIKSVVWMKFVAENCNDTKPFIVKVDDDVVFDPLKLRNVLINYDNDLKDNYFCYVRRYALIARDKKSPWYVPESEISLSYKYHDDFCSGPAYITSTTVILKEWNYLINHKVHFLKGEDVFVTGKLADEVNVGRIHGLREWLIVFNVDKALKSEERIFFGCHDPEHQPIFWKHIYENRLMKVFNFAILC